MKKFAAGLLALAVPMQVFACSVCFSGREDFLQAFYVTTGLLIILPPSILGTVIYYFRKKTKEAQLEQEN